MKTGNKRAWAGRGLPPGRADKPPKISQRQEPIGEYPLLVLAGERPSRRAIELLLLQVLPDYGIDLDGPITCFGIALLKLSHVTLELVMNQPAD